MPPVSLLADLIRVIDHTVIWYFFALNSCYAVLILLTIPELWGHWQAATDEDLDRLMRSDALLPISVLMPAYDMEQNIVASVRAQLALRYPHHEVIVINDGSKDGTLARLRREFRLYEVPPAIPRRIPTQRVRGYYRSHVAARLLVIDKENGGKADALNAGLGAARYPLIVAADADTMIAEDALLRLARPFLLGDPVVGAGGTIRVANGCVMRHGRVIEPRFPRNFLGAMQIPEYLRAFLFGRIGWNRLGGNLIVSGAFGLFRRDHLIEIGGYHTGSVVEDLDIVVRLHKHLRRKKVKYSIPLVPDPVAWTEVPADLRTLGRQRERWHRGLIATMTSHRGALLNPRYGPLGFIHLPFFILGEMLAPVVELVGYTVTLIGLSLGVLSWVHMGLFFSVALGYGVLLTLWCVLLEQATFRMYRRQGDFRRLILYTFLEPFGYRQMTVIWRLKSFWGAARGDVQWGEMRRLGFEPAMSAPTKRDAA
jgi:cellulose synthase/poly-beta-1,6-N-acetylglucosamine synthase-like glycosyltransferase